MANFLNKLLLGKQTKSESLPQYTIKRRVANIKAIWNNEFDDDMGIEKIFRLFLAISPFLFLGTYLKEFFGKKGLAKQELTIDLYVLIKMIFPVTIILFQLTNNLFCLSIMLWFMAETLLYVPTLIFASDIFGRPRSYRRSMLLLFFNYLEITFAFAVIYSTGSYLNKPFVHWFDPIYFSFITAATIGFGDLYPATTTGRFLVTSQTLVFVIFIVLFLNFFSNKVEHKGYFDHTKEK